MDGVGGTNFFDGTDAPAAIGACDRGGQLAHGMAASSEPRVFAQVIALDADACVRIHCIHRTSSGTS